MKDSQRKDVEGSFLLSDGINTLGDKHRPARIKKWTAGKVVCDSLGGEWSPTSKGAELRLKLDNVVATATISKNQATHLYEYSLRLDSFLVGKNSPSVNMDDCLNSLSKEIRSAIDVCSELSDRLRASSNEENRED